jgi:hypothetical protein
MTVMSTSTLLLVDRSADSARHGRPRNLSADRTLAQSSDDAFLDGFIAVRKPADFTGMFRRAVAHFGINAFACGEIDLKNRDRVVYFAVDGPDEWRRYEARHVRDNEVRRCLQVLS